MLPQIDGLEILDELGRGGFGVVHRAREAALDRIVAVKVLSVGDLDDAALRGFEREARLLGRLAEHPHIVTVHATGRTDDGQPWVSMAWLPNGSLADRLRSDGPLAAQDVADIGVRIAGALETAHRHGILHRDVKPENVLLTSYGRPELADFGIARMIGGTQTSAAGVTASLAHAAPEVLDGSPPSAAADVYGLASTLFALLNGRPAFDPGPDGNVSQLVVGILRNPLPDLRTDTVPGPLVDVVEAGLARAVEDRPATAEEFGRLLQEAQRSSSWPVTELVVLDPSEEPAPRPTPASTGTAAMDDATRMHALTPRPEVPPTSPAQDELAVAAATPTPPTPAPAHEDAAQVRAPATGDGGAPARGSRRALQAAAAVAAVAAVGVLGTGLIGGGAGDTEDDGMDATTASSGDAADVLPVTESAEFLEGDNAGTGRVLFRRQLPDGAALGAATDGLALYVTSPQHVQAMTLEDGLARWRVARLSKGPAPLDVVTTGDVVVFRDEGGLRAVSVDGGEDRWTHGRSDTSLRPVVTASGTLLGLGGGIVVAIDADTGEAVWERSFSGVPAALPSVPDVDLTHLAGDGEVVAINADGEVVWTTPMDSGTRMLAASDGGILVVASVGEAALRVRAVDAATGDVRWSRALSGIEPDAVRMTVHDGMVMFGDGMTVVAADINTGEPEWSHDITDGSGTAIAAASGMVALIAHGDAGPSFGLLDAYSGLAACSAPSADTEWPLGLASRWLVASDQGTILAHDPEDCSLAWSYDLPEDANPTAPIIVVDELGHAYTVDDNGWVTGLRLWDA